MGVEIFCIGCSFTAGRYPTQFDKSWPELLAEKVEHQVWNLGIFSNSIHNQLVQLKHYLQKDPNFVILQWTTYPRITYVKDMPTYMSKLDNCLVQKSENYFELENSPTYGEFSNLGILNLNPGKLDSMSPKDIYRRTYETLCTQSVTEFHTYGLDTFFNGILKQYGKKMLVDKGIPHLIFDFKKHDDDPTDTGVDYCIETDMENFLEYTVDDGYHLSTKGNEQIVNKMIMPHIERFLNV